MKVAIPSEIQVGGVVYQVQWGESAQRRMACEGDNGQCNKQTLVIQLNPRMARLPQTFIHEVTHAIDFEYCAGELSEAQVDGVSHGMLQVLRQLGVELVLEDAL